MIPFQDNLRALARRFGRSLLWIAIGVLLGGLIFGFGKADTKVTEVEQHEHAEPSEVTEWTCSMHPQVRSKEPGLCPICGMELIPVQPLPEDAAQFSGVVLSDRAKALLRLRVVPVRRRSDSSAEIRLLGRIEPNETTLKSITVWTGGRIDHLHVNTTGERIHAGQVIATMYSPEVFAAHQDLLVAKRQVERMSGAVESARFAARQALEAARQRLRLLGVPDDELARMETQDQPTRQVKIRTPFGGTVIERIATEGAYVTTGAPLYRVANLSKLWIQLDAYERDLPHLEVGQPVRVEVEALAGESFDGTVTFIDPTLDPRRRTARVRVAVTNKDRRLRPGMFAEAVVEAQARAEEGAPLVIPSTAPLFTGRRAIVYVEAQHDGRISYQPRTVRLGPRLQGFYPVISGLSEGERIVARGAFAIDADLQIRGGPSMMMAPTDEPPEDEPAPIDTTPAERTQLRGPVSAYLSIQTALANDDLKKAQQGATELERTLGTVEWKQPQAAAAAWNELEPSLRAPARRIKEAETIESARNSFEALSDSLTRLVQQFGNPLDETLHVAHCPMAFGSRGASWIQKGQTIDNSYYGESMRSCGEVETSVKPGTHLPPKRASPPPPSRAPQGGHVH